jgi:hypothetical protein
MGWGVLSFLSFSFISTFVLAASHSGIIYYKIKKGLELLIELHGNTYSHTRVVKILPGN